MLARTPDQTTVQFTRRDAGRLVLASVLLVAAMSAILGLDVIPAQTSLELGKPAPFNVYAIRTDQYTSEVLTEQARKAARDAVDPQYDFTIARGASVAAQQLRELDTKVAPIDAAFADGITPELRATLLGEVLPGELSEDVRQTLTSLDPEALDRRPRGSVPGARHRRTLRAPRHRGVHDARRHRQPVRGRPDRARDDARRRPDPAAGRRELLVLGGEHDVGAEPPGRARPRHRRSRGRRARRSSAPATGSTPRPGRRSSGSSSTRAASTSRASSASSCCRSS